MHVMEAGGEAVDVADGGAAPAWKGEEGQSMDEADDGRVAHAWRREEIEAVNEAAWRLLGHIRLEAAERLRGQQVGAWH